MFEGSIVALVTPMRSDGSVDDEALARLVDHHVESGTSAIVAVGTTGESATLDPPEHLDVIAAVVEAAAGRVPVIGGTGANATSEAVELTREALERGVAGCLLVTPYYNKPTQEGLFRHFTAIADAADVPQILYNVPGRTACDMQPDTVVRLSEHPRIIGIKEASGDIARIRELVERCPEDFVILSGEDHLALDTILAGGRGVISVTANVAPAAMSRMCRLALDGDAQGASAIDSTLRALHAALFVESNPIPVKWAVARQGLIPDGIRLPLTPLSERFHQQVLDAMRGAGVLEA